MNQTIRYAKSRRNRAQRKVQHRANVNRFIQSCEAQYLETVRTRMIYG